MLIETKAKYKLYENRKEYGLIQKIDTYRIKHILLDNGFIIKIRSENSHVINIIK